MEDKLSQFIDEIIESKQLSGMTPEVRAQLKEDLLGQLEDRINAALVEAMPPAKVDELNYMLDQEGVTDAQITEFIAGSGVNTTQVAASTMLQFRDLYLGK